MSNTKSAFLIAVLIVLAIFGYQFAMKPEETLSTNKENGEESPLAVTPESPVVSAPTPTTNELSVGERKIRTEVTYIDPSGETKVAFVLIVDKDGIIVDAPTEILATNPIAIQRQTAFAKDLPAAVKGKKLSELTAIDRVGGSSLTTKAFNDALATLKANI